MPTVVSAGNGPTRDALIAFKVPGALVSAAAPDALVIEETGPSMAAWYTPGPNRGMASYGTLVDLARQTAAADGAEVGRVFLVGHSEGGEAVRTHLIEGADPEGVVIADGTYSAFNTPEHIDVWRRYIDRAKSCGRIAVFSHASLPASLGLSPQATLEASPGTGRTAGWLPRGALLGRPRRGGTYAPEGPSARADDRRGARDVGRIRGRAVRGARGGPDCRGGARCRARRVRRGLSGVLG